MRYGIAQGDNGHVVPCKGQRCVRRSEEPQDRIHPDQGDQRKYQAGYDIERNVVTKDLACYPIVFLPQKDGNHGCSANSHQRAKSGGNVHQGEGYRKAGDGKRTNIGNMADIDAVHHIIKRRRCHGNDAGDSVFLQELADRLCAQFCGYCA